MRFYHIYYVVAFSCVVDAAKGDMFSSALVIFAMISAAKAIYDEHLESDLT